MEWWLFWWLLFGLAQWVVGLLYANMVEHYVHRYILHGLGKKPNSIFAFHWHQHHRKARQNEFFDEDYSKSLWNWNARGKEALGLFLIWLPHVLLLTQLPVFVMAVSYGALNYYFTHWLCHKHPEFAKRDVPWHYWHHMGKNQNTNWNVTRPWFDKIAGTHEIPDDNETTKT